MTKKSKKSSTKLKVGDRVRSTFGSYGTGMIVDLKSYLNWGGEWCHLIVFDNGEIDTHHPQFLQKISKLEESLE